MPLEFYEVFPQRLKAQEEILDFFKISGLRKDGMLIEMIIIHSATMNSDSQGNRPQVELDAVK